MGVDGSHRSRFYLNGFHNNSFFQRQLTCNKYLLQLQGSGARLHGSGQFAAGVRRNHNGSM